MNELDDVMDSSEKYKVWLSTDGKITIEFEANHINEVSNTLVSLTNVWQQVLRMSGEAKAKSVTSINDAVNKTIENQNAPVRPHSDLCAIHGVKMAKDISKAGRPYSYHDMAEGRCFGNGVRPKKY